MDLVANVEMDVREQRLLQAGDRILVAVSGGPDSVALLHILFLLSGRWNWKLTVAHVNHLFRGEESEREAAFVAQWAERLGIPCEVGRLDVPQYIEDTGKNPQAAARELRYGFLHQAASLHGANKIALAHHADDQAETMLMRLLRGTGPAGLAGIPVLRSEQKVELVRPLLRIYKSEIVTYCEAAGLTYYTDSSNLDTKYFRNEIRLEVLPYLQRYNAQLPQSLNRLSQMMTVENDYLEQQTRDLWEQGVAQESDFAKWSRNWFARVHVALQRRLIKLILNYLALEGDSIDFLKLEQIREAIVRDEPSNLSLYLGNDLVLTREYDGIMIHNYVVPPLPYQYPVHRGQPCLDIPETGMRIDCRWGSRESVSNDQQRSASTTLFDADHLALPLQVRSRQEGDRMQLFGLNGSKKVKDIFIDTKIPPSQRQRIPVVTDALGRILWLPGVRRSSHAPVTDKTERFLQMTFT
ncbi:tRNA lysidine(34) synthetase TilS [Paenibacillus rigui]|uniref:tRNA(Ile)-lysidine synthase n=1 Tax=Paenibacillus rigui TaxID=554312 RepID=A0A229UGK5_9BACL|nr:tRNA lysidine(34) synthetase TilS [Paenibacillus rigui]OXM82491.1 tRNA lysidine(34) synthetase TilS [Paenibacillus rigui]